MLIVNYYVTRIYVLFSTYVRISYDDVRSYYYCLLRCGIGPLAKRKVVFWQR